jgi:hypothetical protein
MGIGLEVIQRVALAVLQEPLRDDFLLEIFMQSLVPQLPHLGFHAAAAGKRFAGFRWGCRRCRGHNTNRQEQCRQKSFPHTVLRQYSHGKRKTHDGAQASAE